jgi:hypothetical protein
VNLCSYGHFHQGPHQADNRRPWLPKMDFPRFDDSNVRIWLDKCAAYFQLYAIPPDFKVIAASLHMVDHATHWYQSYKHYAGVHTWEHFVVAVSQEFEVNTHRVKTMALSTCVKLVQWKITNINLTSWFIISNCMMAVSVKQCWYLSFWLASRKN